jgi:hypothetical protein
MKIECQHIAANCNPMPNVLEFLTADVIVYCFKNQVGIYSIKTNNVYMNLHCGTFLLIKIVPLIQIGRTALKRLNNKNIGIS